MKGYECVEAGQNMAMQPPAESMKNKKWATHREVSRCIKRGCGMLWPFVLHRAQSKSTLFFCVLLSECVITWLGHFTSLLSSRRRTMSSGIVSFIYMYMWAEEHTRYIYSRTSWFNLSSGQLLSSYAHRIFKLWYAWSTVYIHGPWRTKMNFYFCIEYI